MAQLPWYGTKHEFPFLPNPPRVRASKRRRSRSCRPGPRHGSTGSDLDPPSVSLLRLSRQQGCHHWERWIGRVGICGADSARLLDVAQWKCARLLPQRGPGDLPGKGGGLGVPSPQGGPVPFLPALAWRTCAGDGVRDEPVGRGGTQRPCGEGNQGRLPSQEHGPSVSRNTTDDRRPLLGLPDGRAEDC